MQDKLCIINNLMCVEIHSISDMHDQVLKILVRAAPIEPPEKYREVNTTLTTVSAFYSGITRHGYAVMSASGVG